jgi:hypothetical protein
MGKEDGTGEFRFLPLRHSAEEGEHSLLPRIRRGKRGPAVQVKMSYPDLPAASTDAGTVPAAYLSLPRGKVVVPPAAAAAKFTFDPPLPPPAILDHKLLPFLAEKGEHCLLR